MKPRDKKLALLRKLSQEMTPISLPDLLLKLPEDYRERTVRRWLNELIQEGLVTKSGSKRGTKYLAIQSSGKNHNQVSSCFSSASAAIIDQVRQPLYERQPTTYNKRWIDSYKPNRTFYLSEALREHLHRSGDRSSNEDPAGTYAHKIYNRLLIDLSYNSSRLEGNTYSLLDTERLLLEGESAKGKLDEERVMIINHKEAIRFLVDNASQIQSDLQTICTVHYLLSDGLLEPKYSGKIRDHSVRIGGSTYLPLANQQQLQMHLDHILKKALLIEDPFEQSLFILIHVSYLQAFSDVNKRTARLSANIPFITENFVPLSFNDVESADYNSAIIAIYELQDVRPMIDLYVYSYLRTCTAYDVTVQALGFDEIRVRYRQQRREILRMVIRKELVNSAMLQFIQFEAEKKIPEKDRTDFIKNVLEDLEHIDQNRLAGLGITPLQLEVWLEKKKK